MKQGEKRLLAIAVLIAMLCGVSRQEFTVQALSDTAYYSLQDEMVGVDAMIEDSMVKEIDGLPLDVLGAVKSIDDSFEDKFSKALEDRIAQEEKIKAEQEAAEREKAKAAANNSPTGNYTVDGSATNISVSLYGVDCYGCSGQYTGRGGTASGIQLDVNAGVMQSDGSWLPGVTYNGYYIIAAGSQYALGSIVEISNHNLSGAGIVPGVPFLAIVADRGGAIHGNKIDLYAGSERSLQIYNPGSGATMRVVR